MNKQAVLAVLAAFISVAHSGCPFQNPFWFVDKPFVLPLTGKLYQN